MGLTSCTKQLLNMLRFEKADANTLKIIFQKPVEDIIETYQYQDLENNLQALQREKQEFNADIDKKITAAQAALDAADSLQINKIFKTELTH